MRFSSAAFAASPATFTASLAASFATFAASFASNRACSAVARSSAAPESDTAEVDSLCAMREALQPLGKQRTRNGVWSTGKGKNWWSVVHVARVVRGTIKCQ
eukprot:scaffold67895_cov60-Phaeocystis_antarctica.AAC.2